MDEFVVVAGPASRGLAEATAAALGVRLGALRVEPFPDGEISVLLEESVRGRTAFLLQATSPPVDRHFVDLLAMADACRRAAAERIVAVVPYFGYARSDRRRQPGEPVMASLVAGLIEAAGVDHVVTVDAHSPQLEGFFRIPMDDLTALPALADAVSDRVPDDAVVVAPDLGAAERARRFAARFGAPVAMLHKRRTSGTEVEVTRVAGDVRGRPCVIVDDMVSTGGTITEAVRALREAGARPDFTVVATHGVLVHPARERLASAGIRDLILADTIPVSREDWPNAGLVSVAPLLAETIRRLTTGGPLRNLA